MSHIRLTALLAAALPCLLFAIPARSAGADPEVQRWKREEIVQAGLAPASFRGMPLVGGVVELSALGDGSGLVTYGSPGSRRARVRLSWQERMPRGANKGYFEPGASDPHEWWHPTHRVRVHTDALGGGEDSDFIRLSKQIADKLAARALRWEHPYDEIALTPEVEGYRLHRSRKRRFEVRDRSKETTLTYELTVAEHLSSAVRAQRRRGITLEVRWLPRGTRPSASDQTWRIFQAEAASLGIDNLTSESHYIRITLRGKHHSGSQFYDLAHRKQARRVAATIAQHFQRVAEPRSGTAIDTPLVAERPQSNASTDNASGRVIEIRGGVRIMRGGRRINLRSGGEVARGDTILTSQTGTIQIRFENPRAGPLFDGFLKIGPGSKVTIDVGPYQSRSKDRTPRIRVEEGAAQFSRPHNEENPRFEFGTPKDVAIFGLHGTDAVIYRTEKGYLLALENGKGDLTLKGRDSRTLAPNRAYEVGPDGQFIAEVPITKDWYRSTLEVLSLAAPEFDFEAPFGEDLDSPFSEKFGEPEANAGSKSWITGTWRSVKPSRGMTLVVSPDGGFTYRPNSRSTVTGSWKSKGTAYELTLMSLDNRPLIPSSKATAILTGVERLRVDFETGEVGVFEREVPKASQSRTWHSTSPRGRLTLVLSLDGTVTYSDARTPDRVAIGTWTGSEADLRIDITRVGHVDLETPRRITGRTSGNRLELNFPTGEKATFALATASR